MIFHLNEHEISDNQSSVIKEIAQKYHPSPQVIFEKMQVQGKSATTQSKATRGCGRMSILQICNDNNISLEEALENLKNKGIEADSQSILRDLGKNYNLSPIEIVKIIENFANKE
jgi:hypothetical protein